MGRWGWGGINNRVHLKQKVSTQQHHLLTEPPPPPAAFRSFKVLERRRRVHQTKRRENLVSGYLREGVN